MHQLLFQGNRATGALVESGGDTFTVEGDQIILSAGAIGSPQLLMLSGVGPAEHLEDMGIPVVLDSPGVGQNLKDHPKLYVTWRIRDGYSRGDSSAAGSATPAFHRSVFGIPERPVHQFVSLCYSANQDTESPWRCRIRGCPSRPG